MGIISSSEIFSSIQKPHVTKTHSGILIVSAFTKLKLKTRKKQKRILGYLHFIVLVFLQESK